MILLEKEEVTNDKCREENNEDVEEVNLEETETNEVVIYMDDMDINLSLHKEWLNFKKMVIFML